MRHLTYNPQRDDAHRLDRLTCGSDRLALLEQLLLALRGELGQRNHQHHLLIGPRGSGKTHVLRVLVGARLEQEPALVSGYCPVVLPEETPARAPADLPLKLAERLAWQLEADDGRLAPEKRAVARGACLRAIDAAAAKRDPLLRLSLAVEALETAAEGLDRILLAVVENLDSVLYLGPRRGRKRRIEQHWALRRWLQRSPHLLLLAGAPTVFGAVGAPEASFYDFFREHSLPELSNDEVLEIIRLRVEEEAATPSADPRRLRRVHHLHDHFQSRAPRIRGLLAITGGLPRYAHLLYDILVETDVARPRHVLDRFLDELTPYFQQRADPRALPEGELDVLYSLASAPRPLRPTELSQRLFGVPINEVSELLDRLQQRGLVRRAGRPGGRAVTWDVSEPLYRVWTRFRAGSSERDQLLLLADLVAALYEPEEIEAELLDLAMQLRMLAEADPQRPALLARKELMELAARCPVDGWKMELAEPADTVLGRLASIPAGELPEVLPEVLESFSLEELREARRVAPHAPLVRLLLANRLLSRISEGAGLGEAGGAEALLTELRSLVGEGSDGPDLAPLLAAALVFVLLSAADDPEASFPSGLLNEVRSLAQQSRDDESARAMLGFALYADIKHGSSRHETRRAEEGLAELRHLVAQHPTDALPARILARTLRLSVDHALVGGAYEVVESLVDELRSLAKRHSDSYQVRQHLAAALFARMMSLARTDDRLGVEATVGEIRRLADQAPDDVETAELLAAGLSLANGLGAAANDTQDADSFLGDLRSLGRRWPGSALIHAALGAALVHSACPEERREGEAALERAERGFGGDEADEARCIVLRLRGAAKLAAGNLSAALAHLEAALRLQERYGDADDAAETLAQVGAVLASSVGRDDETQERALALLGGIDVGGEEGADRAAALQRTILATWRHLVRRLVAGDLDAGLLLDLLPRLEAVPADGSSGFLGLLGLALSTAQDGEQKALAHASEETRRAVRLLLEQTWPQES